MKSEIIGKKFRRNKYGLSLWEDTVYEVIYESKVVLKPGTEMDVDGKKTPLPKLLQIMKKNKIGFRLVPKVLGKHTLKAYEFDEIIFMEL